MEPLTQDEQAQIEKNLARLEGKTMFEIAIELEEEEAARNGLPPPDLSKTGDE